MAAVQTRKNEPGRQKTQHVNATTTMPLWHASSCRILPCIPRPMCCQSHLRWQGCCRLTCTALSHSEGQGAGTHLVLPLVPPRVLPLALPHHRVLLVLPGVEAAAAAGLWVLLLVLLLGRQQGEAVAAMSRHTCHTVECETDIESQTDDVKLA